MKISYFRITSVIIISLHFPSSSSHTLNCLACSEHYVHGLFFFPYFLLSRFLLEDSFYNFKMALFHHITTAHNGKLNANKWKILKKPTNKWNEQQKKKKIRTKRFLLRQKQSKTKQRNKKWFYLIEEEKLKKKKWERKNKRNKMKEKCNLWAQCLYFFFLQISSTIFVLLFYILFSLHTSQLCALGNCEGEKYCETKETHQATQTKQNNNNNKLWKIINNYAHTLLFFSLWFCWSVQYLFDEKENVRMKSFNKLPTYQQPNKNMKLSFALNKAFQGSH